MLKTYYIQYWPQQKYFECKEESDVHTSDDISSLETWYKVARQKNFGNAKNGIIGWNNSFWYKTVASDIQQAIAKFWVDYHYAFNDGSVPLPRYNYEELHNELERREDENIE